MPAPGSRLACIRVRDTGCGMDQATLKRIFEPFFTTKPVGKGTGLGLSTVFGIVEQHSGWIDVQSTVGSGTEFKLFFPLAQPSTPPASKPASAQGAQRHERILLVEDDASVRRVTAMLLRRHGFVVTEATTGVEALNTFVAGNAHFDMVITDMVMPGSVSGAKLVEEVKAIDPKIKVLVVTGYSAEMANVALAKETGTTLLMKPIPCDKLITTVGRILDGHPVANPGLAHRDEVHPPHNLPLRA
jgi:CheY-like chemotaxis protein